MTMEELVKSMLSSSPGWGGLDRDPKSIEDDRRRQASELRAAAEVLAAPFRTPVGRRCLDELVARTLTRPMLMLPVEGASMEAQALYCAFRQGQNQIVTILIEACRAAHATAPEQLTEPS